MDQGGQAVNKQSSISQWLNLEKQNPYNIKNTNKIQKYRI
jgi:hypothetical protein